MPRSLPPLNALRAFEAAGRHGSFSRAAEELAVSHSSISRHVRGLEQRLGVQLFRDVARGVELTAEGRGYLQRVSPVFDVISEATEEMTGRASGVVTISCEPTFAQHWLMPRLSRFLEAYPEVEPRIEASSMLADLGAFEADVAIRSVIHSQPEHISYVITNAPVYAYGCPQRFGHISDPAELVTLRRYRDRRGDPWRDWFIAAGVDPDQVPAPEWRLRASLSIEAALAGLGVLLITEDVAERHVRRGDLVRLFDIGLRGGSYQLLLEAQAERRRAVRMFRDWIIQEGAPFRQRG